MQSTTGRILKELTINSWWVIFFMILCYLFYEQGLKKQKRDFAKLHERFLELEQEKVEAQALRHDLMIQINSQSDPAWVELTLMKGLGLVPEGQTKVLFIKKE